MIILGSDVIEPMIVGSDVVEPLCWFRCYEPMIVGGLRGTTVPDVIGIVKDVILVILPAPHPRCVAAGTYQCSC